MPATTDLCYENAGISANPNSWRTNWPGKVACDQAFCNRLANTTTTSPDENKDAFWTGMFVGLSFGHPVACIP